MNTPKFSGLYKIQFPEPKNESPSFDNTLSLPEAMDLTYNVEKNWSRLNNKKATSFLVTYNAPGQIRQKGKNGSEILFKQPNHNYDLFIATNDDKENTVSLLENYGSFPSKSWNNFYSEVVRKRTDMLKTIRVEHNEAKKLTRWQVTG